MFIATFRQAKTTTHFVLHLVPDVHVHHALQLCFVVASLDRSSSWQTAGLDAQACSTVCCQVRAHSRAELRAETLADRIRRRMCLVQKDMHKPRLYIRWAPAFSNNICLGDCFAAEMWLRDEANHEMSAKSTKAALNCSCPCLEYVTVRCGCDAMNRKMHHRSSMCGSRSISDEQPSWLMVEVLKSPVTGAGPLCRPAGDGVTIGLQLSNFFTSARPHGGARHRRAQEARGRTAGAKMQAPPSTVSVGAVRPGRNFTMPSVPALRRPGAFRPEGRTSRKE